jgi:hypothetical protein
MAVGENSLMGHGSYLAVGRETTYGTYATSTAGLNFLSSSIKVMKETKILEEIQTSRTNSNFIQLGKVVQGEIEYYFNPSSVACNYLLQNAFGGGAITTATATGDTVGSGTFSHIYSVNDFKATYSSLSINHRKGESTGGKIFEYTGIRVNEYTFTAEIDEPLVVTNSIIAKDATLTANDVSASLSTSAQSPLSFVNGRFSVETATGSLTTTSFWHVQSFEFKISNNLQSDSGARRIGSDLLQVLPAGLAQFELSCQIRFDTSTAYDAMLAGTRLVGEFEFQGDTLSGSTLRESIKITMPNLRISDAGDPEIGGAGELLTSNVVFAVLRDPTASGYAVRAQVINKTTSYA